MIGAASTSLSITSFSHFRSTTNPVTGIRIARYRHFQRVVVTVTVAAGAAAEDLFILLLRPGFIPVVVGSGEGGPACQVEHSSRLYRCPNTLKVTNTVVDGSAYAVHQTGFMADGHLQPG